MPSNSLPDADLNLPEMKTKSPSCPAGGVHMYGVGVCKTLRPQRLLLPVYGQICGFVIPPKILDIPYQLTKFQTRSLNSFRDILLTSLKYPNFQRAITLEK